MAILENSHAAHPSGRRGQDETHSQSTTHPGPTDRTIRRVSNAEAQMRSRSPMKTLHVSLWAAAALAFISLPGCVSANKSDHGRSNTLLVSHAAIDLVESTFECWITNQSSIPIYVFSEDVRRLAYSMTLTDAYGKWWRIREEIVFVSPPDLDSYSLQLPPGTRTPVRVSLFDRDFIDHIPEFNSGGVPPNNSMMNFSLSTHLTIVLRTDGPTVHLWLVGGAGPAHVRARTGF